MWLRSLGHALSLDRERMPSQTQGLVEMYLSAKELLAVCSSKLFLPHKKGTSNKGRQMGWALLTQEPGSGWMGPQRNAVLIWELTKIVH
jgi:hypothetical protein